MQFYWRHKRLFAIYTEFSKALGSRPFFKCQRIHQELIVEIPYGCVIITPANRLLVEHSAPRYEQKHGMRKHEKTNRRLSGASTGTTEN